MQSFTILVIDDELSFLRTIKRILIQEGFSNVLTETNPQNVLNIINNNKVDLILLDISFPDFNGITLLENIFLTHPHIPVIMITAHDSYSLAFKAIQIGAYDYIVKPPDTNRLLLTIKRALEHRLLLVEKETYNSDILLPVFPDNFSNIISNNLTVFKIFRMIEVFAPTNETILLTGETGTGKDLIAKKIHDLSPRANGPFVTVNIASITPSLFESELFGHEKGSFTGADKFRIGYFESADQGTIFLDEIGELSMEMQGKLLRVIQYNEIFRVGSTSPIKLNLRIIAATNKDLISSIKSNDFRADLYYRLNRASIKMPPLRNRLQDIPLLVSYFISLANKKFDKSVSGINDEILLLLQSYNFPGNIRELENLIFKAVAETNNNEMISTLELPQTLFSFETKNNSVELISIDQAVSKHVKNIVNYFNGDTTRAAITLGVSERTVQRKLKNFNP
ncbi:MAG: sigma-54-dependent Fis family transcriptional regulator [Ignavibacteriales bacterium]|nr:sigma-54-dependent Fis family transcriptional regulator [Ignavibacteriales bacterium]